MAGGPIDLLSRKLWHCYPTDGLRRERRLSGHNAFALNWQAQCVQPAYWNDDIVQDLSNANWLHSRTRPNAWMIGKRLTVWKESFPKSEQHFDHFFTACKPPKIDLGLPLVQYHWCPDDIKTQRLIGTTRFAVHRLWLRLTYLRGSKPRPESLCF